MPDDGPSLAEVARTDRLLDALAAGRSPSDSPDPGDRALTALMAGWRDELRSPPANQPITAAAATAALQQGTRGGAGRRPARRGLTVVGSAAATLLALGGFGAVVAGSYPGNPLYGLRSALFGEPKSVVDERVVLTAKTELDRVQQMITLGDWDQAAQRLSALGDTVQTVHDTAHRQDLVDQWNRLNVQVQQRDPNAVAPPSVPLEMIAPQRPPEVSATTSVTLSLTPSAVPSRPESSTAATGAERPAQ